MKRIFGFILIFLIAIFNDDILSAAIHDSVKFCANTVVPSLYVYMILSEAFVEYGLVKDLGDICYNVLNFGKRKSYILSVFLFSSICGAPLGAKLSYGAFKSGMLSKKDAVLLNCMTNNISLSFVLGVCSKINDMYYIAFIIQVLSSVIVTILFSKIIDLESCVDISKRKFDVEKRFKISEIIERSTNAMIKVCASIVVFSIIGELLCLYFPTGQYIRGLFEFSSGISKIEKNDMVLMTAFLSFGGFSVHNQILSLWNGELKYRYLLLPKITQMLFSILFSKIFILFVDKSKVLM